MWVFENEDTCTVLTPTYPYVPSHVPEELQQLRLELPLNSTFIVSPAKGFAGIATQLGSCYF